MKNIGSSKNRVEDNKTLKLIIIISSLVLPIIALLNALGFAGTMDSEFFVFFNWIWIGFYSSIFSIIFLKKNIWIKLLIVINILIVLFALVSSFLAGIPGLLYMLIKMLVPFIPDKWIGIDLNP